MLAYKHLYMLELSVPVELVEQLHTQVDKLEYIDEDREVLVVVEH